MTSGWSSPCLPAGSSLPRSLWHLYYPTSIELKGNMKLDIYRIVSRFTGDIECILSHSSPVNLILTFIILAVTIYFLIYVAYTIILVKFYKRKRALQKNQSVYSRFRRSFAREHMHHHRDIELAEGCLTNGTSTPGITFFKTLNSNSSQYSEMRIKDTRPMVLLGFRSICTHIIFIIRQGHRTH